MKGVILAAGKGTRLYPVTRVIPKPLLPICNRMTLEYAFDQLKDCGITDICIVVGETESAIRESLGDGSSFGVKLTFVRQTDPHGLAHAVSFAKDFLGDDDFMLYLGDAIYDRGFKGMVDKFYATGCANLNLVKVVEDPRRFGVANVVNGRIVKLVEKPAQPESNLAMAGMYIFSKALWAVLPDLKPSARGEYEITDAIQLLVDKGELVVPGVYEGQWFDTGTLDSFLETSAFLADGHKLIADSAKVTGSTSGLTVVGDNSLLDCKSSENVVVLPGSKVRISGHVKNAVLGGTVNVDGDLVNAIRYDDMDS